MVCTDCKSALSGSEVVTVSKKVIKLKKAEKLQRLGVLFVEGTTEAGQKQLGLLYKGEVIATGTGKQLKETLKNVLKHGAGEADIVKILDDLIDTIKNRTKPSLPKNPNAVTKGLKTRINPKENPENIASLNRENEAAEILAKEGFDIEQQPQVPNITKEPDYLIEGKVFDCFAPFNKKKSARNIWAEVKKKIEREQTKRVVLMLKYWDGDLVKLQEQFSKWKIEGLEEVIYITKENVIGYLKI